MAPPREEGAPEPTSSSALSPDIGEAEGSGEAGERPDDPLADAVQAVLGWASDDLARFTELLVWLYRTADRATVSPEEADGELAALGLDRPAFAPLRELLTGLRLGEGDPRALAPRVRHGADVARRALRELPDQHTRTGPRRQAARRPVGARQPPGARHDGLRRGG
ncbi:CHAT domain-containing protein OS=Streptomyces antimycoticus OX=68175 GN=SSPO_084130 PE=4 SV=1 [Streptomyces antimycoticus]